MTKNAKLKQLEKRFSMRITRSDYAKYLRWELGQATAAKWLATHPENIQNVSLPKIHQPILSTKIGDWRRNWNGWQETLTLVIGQANQRLGKKNSGLCLGVEFDV